MAAAAFPATTPTALAARDATAAAGTGAGQCVTRRVTRVIATGQGLAAELATGEWAPR